MKIDIEKKYKDDAERKQHEAKNKVKNLLKEKSHQRAKHGANKYLYPIG